MSEKSPVYQANSLPQNLQAFKNRPCCLPFSDENYLSPTAAEVGQLIKLAGWSQRQTAILVGVSWSKKGSTTVRKWKTPEGNDEHRKIPYSAWRLLLIYAGVVDVTSDLTNIQG
ncbi:hypothetical protein KCM76_22325 [Zooshikella marina]|uniref:hypothetical protein n=1 Tax=Zooshikella ganghwensis TaxID=202772 RepID=UPI001BB0001F|nr:hypothetical protein [Zooshikella ganghwensis]MBU2708746.1 hypothetical protein [Zooshikella ganghwensis]